MLMVLPILRDHSPLDSGPVLMNEPVGIDQLSNTKSSLQKYQSEKYFPAFKSCNLVDVEYFSCLKRIAAEVYSLPLWNTSTFILVLSSLISFKWTVAQEQVVMKNRRGNLTTENAKLKF